MRSPACCAGIAVEQFFSLWMSISVLVSSLLPAKQLAYTSALRNPGTTGFNLQRALGRVNLMSFEIGTAMILFLLSSIAFDVSSKTTVAIGVICILPGMILAAVHEKNHLLETI